VELLHLDNDKCGAHGPENESQNPLSTEQGIAAFKHLFGMLKRQYNIEPKVAEVDNELRPCLAKIISTGIIP